MEACAKTILPAQFDYMIIISRCRQTIQQICTTATTCTLAKIATFPRKHNSVAFNDCGANTLRIDIDVLDQNTLICDSCLTV